MGNIEHFLNTKKIPSVFQYQGLSRAALVPRTKISADRLYTLGALL